jgi:hypothetical protein
MGNYDDIFGESGFIKRSPNWILRWGLTLVTVFFLAIIILSFIVKYNEVLTADVVITSKSPIIKLATKQNGILLYQSINSGDTINGGKVLGIIENNGNLDDIVFLSNKLNKSPETNEFKFLEDLFSKNLKVGSIIMPSYNAFLNAYNQYSLNAFFKYDSLKSHGLIEQFNKQNLGLSNKKAVISAMENELELSKQNYERYGNLFEKGVISKMDLEEREKEYLIKQQNLSRLKEEQVGLTQVMSNTQFEQQYIKVEEKSNNIKLANELAISKQELITAIEKWKDLYLIVSPVKGKLFYDNQWSNYQNVKEGDVIYTILPLEEGEIIARCEVPFYNSSKLQKNQKALIKLDSYPYREWGTLKGKVISILELPVGKNQSGYRVYIELDNLSTSYHKEINFRQEMTGTAEIVLEETTLIQRIFYQFRSLWDSSTT